jgi:signal peptidase I
VWAAAAPLALLALARASLLVVTVNGPSMQPGLPPGSRVLVLRGSWWVRTGRVVVLRPVASQRRAKEYLLVKRVAARAGETVPESVRPAVGTERVPAGKLVVLGDSPAASADSRQWGFAAVRDVIGVLAVRLR